MNNSPNLEEIKQEHESWLSELEGLAVEAIAANEWTPVLSHLSEMMTWLDVQPYWDDPKIQAESPATITAVRGIKVSDISNLFNAEASAQPTKANAGNPTETNR